MDFEDTPDEAAHRTRVRALLEEVGHLDAVAGLVRAGALDR